MSDRPRLDQTVQPRFEETEPGGDSTYLRGLLKATFQQLSNSLSGGGERLAPFGASDAAAEGFIPDSADPDIFELDGEEFVPTPPAKGLPETPFQSPAFDAASLPTGGDGKFLRGDSGKVVFSRGIGEAPDNKANRNHPTYESRAEFVTGALNYVINNFGASSAGQYRAVDAPVTANRSHNSDHYSGGAFDVRASSREEANRILSWASQQPWVSFAQVYSDGTLIHVSANVAAFGGDIPVSVSNEPPSLTVQPEPDVVAPPPIEPGRPS